MTLGDTLVAVWRRVLVEDATEVELEGAHLRVVRTPNKGLRTVGFSFEGQALEGIEQNPQTTSRWAELAQQGQRIMQFSTHGRYVANVCEGKLTRYPAWKALGLPE